MLPVPIWDSLPDLAWKDKVCLLTYLSLQGPQVETPLRDDFQPGLYIRTMKIPAGTLLTGREHLRGHLMRLIEGSVIVIAPDGRFHFDAPSEMHTKPGFHAIVYAQTDVLAATVHPNPEESRDIDALEALWFGPPANVVDRGKLIYEGLCLPQSQPLPH